MLKWIIGYCLLSGLTLWFLARSRRYFSLPEQAPRDFSMSEQTTHDAE